MHIPPFRPWLWAFLLLATLITCGCGYPQAGYYALVGLNHTGEQVASYPFMVDEITDDSEMTTGFMLLLPQGGSLIEIPVGNSEDVSRRSWNFAIATEDTASGSLEVSLSHFNGILQFSGEYQADPALQPWPIAGKVVFDARSSWLEFNAGLPHPHVSLDSVFSFELVQVSQAEFETALGGPVGNALRVAQAPVSLEVVEQAPAAQPKPRKKPETPPKPPTRGTGRGR